MAAVLKYLPIISPVLVIIGWLIINLQNNHRETRKEVRDNLNDIYKKIEHIHKEAIIFHTTEWDDLNASLINSDIYRVISSINDLTTVIGINSSTECKNFRQSITLKNFDRSVHKILSYDEQQISDITDATHELTDKLKKNFIQKYLSSKHWWLFEINIKKRIIG